MKTPTPNTPDEQRNVLAIRLRRFSQKINRHFIVFVLIGLCTFTLDYILYFLFLDIQVPMSIAKATSSSVAVFFNYLFNSYFNFGGNNLMNIKSLLLYFGLYAILIGIHVLINRIFFNFLNQEQYAVILAMGISVFINYFCVKKFFYYQNIK